RDFSQFASQTQNIIRKLCSVNMQRRWSPPFGRNTQREHPDDRIAQRLNYFSSEMPIGRYRICGGESHAGDERLERVTAPPTATTGSPSEFAVAKPVTRFEQPGPDVTNATPALPVIRPIPPAMNAAFCSCRQTTVLIFESNNVSKTLSIFA